MYCESKARAAAMALGSVLAVSVLSADFVSSAVELEAGDLPGAALVAFTSLFAAALLAVDRASICRKFGTPPAACVEPPELEPAVAPAGAPVLPDRPVPVLLGLPPAVFAAALDLPGELDPPAVLGPLEPPAALEPLPPSERLLPLAAPGLPDAFAPLAAPAPLELPLADLPDGAVSDPAAAPFEVAPVPDAPAEPVPPLAAPPRSAAMPLPEAREEAPVGAGGEEEIDSRPTPMHSVRARAL